MKAYLSTEAQFKAMYVRWEALMIAAPAMPAEALSESEPEPEPKLVKGPPRNPDKRDAYFVIRYKAQQGKATEKQIWYMRALEEWYSPDEYAALRIPVRRVPVRSYAASPPARDPLAAQPEPYVEQVTMFGIDEPAPRNAGALAGVWR